MSGLYSSLNSSVMALNAHSRAIETTGKNLANVNNEAYARQRVIFGDRGTVLTPDGATSLGLEALGVQQLRDELLDRQVLRESAQAAALATEQAGYQRAQAGLGQGIDRAGAADAAGGAGSQGLAGAIDDFFNAFQSLASRPSDGGERVSLLQKAAVLTDRFQLTDRRLAQVQADLDAQIAGDVAEANRLLATIADLNAQINRLEATAPGAAVDLRDQRQAKFEALASKMAFEVREIAGGTLQLVAPDGGGGDIVLLDHALVAGPVAFTGTQITAGAAATPLALAGGAIKGALTARDGAVQTLRSDLDLLARQFVVSVNAAYNPTGATGDFFDAGGTTASALRLASTLNAGNLKTSDGGAAGDNTLARAVAQLAGQGFSTAGGDHIDGTFGGYLRQSVSRLGEALSGANARVEDQENIERLVRSQRDSVSGVSLDEELADLMKYQRAFQASSRVFNVVDDLLEVVVNRLGVG